MSLVAYDASSDEESDYEDEAPKAIVIEKPTKVPAVPQQPEKLAAGNGHISDDEDDFLPTPVENEKDFVNNLSTLLPKPKNNANLADILESFAKPTFNALPTPKAITTQTDIEEEDDEFLHKKPNEEIIEKPNKNNDVKKLPVKITIPSLKNFKDVEKEMADKAKYKSSINPTRTSSTSGLLSILPKAKSEQNFAKCTNSSGADNINQHTTKCEKPIMPAFVPDTVKHRRPATNTEDVDRLKSTKKKHHLNQAKQISASSHKTADSDESGDEDNNTDAATGDFFSFNTDQSLPEVSVNEINALVAKKAAKIVETTANYLKSTNNQNGNAVEEMQIDEQELAASRKRYHQDQQLHPEALQALAGSSTKRRRQQQSDIQVIDINSSQVLPNKDEWMRTALASSTTYQPTGVLVDEEPATGTRRKHQITYLAHKAKANEAELQAMWSANRQNRRATQSKYGF
ncbi:hypothetical protein FF38_00721 [Lucilia cuprina]|uniref:Proline-rich protein PRCC n=1 Tax=Lucilia cuprina TaxID=7375 RepID=A0A0L0C1E1_LUCCU|nr:Proline-rich protein PRCC [Lucilia cuprina]KNC26071.1 hypothetical protein FF38_00721 [Lucilia cuprina]